MTTSFMHRYAAPLYLLLCLFAGGSIQNPWTVLALQLIGIAAIAYALIDSAPITGRRSNRLLLVAVFGFLLAGAVQLIPLPPGLAASLPGREWIASGDRMLGIAAPWRAISLSPDDTVAALLALVPPTAMALLTLRSERTAVWLMAAGLLFATLASIALGFLQVTGHEDYYLYPWVALNTPAGLFANPNHAATLMLVLLPFGTALLTWRYQATKRKDERSLVIAIGLALLLVVAVGIVTNHSLAVLLLGVPVAAACALLVLPGGHLRLGRIAVLLALLTAVGGAALFLSVGEMPDGQNRASVETRKEIWSTTGRAIKDHWATGSGLGTFANIYPHYEDPAKVRAEFANRAHNDFLELALEMGIVGVLLALAFLLWWGRTALAIWRSADSSLFARSATVASAAMILHSIVDFPLKTPALAAAFGMCIGLMAGRHERDPVKGRAKHRRLEDLG